MALGTVVLGSVVIENGCKYTRRVQSPLFSEDKKVVFIFLKETFRNVKGKQ